ncbi:hypothetical protein V5E97_08070 [Singulisphaera sp. Ch08]|uniref:DUF4321 domain-containing protein n=1 Tax=Singulisphaera sp. Ch08 TaxID=3120278 RepID=A0AAU7CLQ7_9BACT
MRRAWVVLAFGTVLGGGLGYLRGTIALRQIPEYWTEDLLGDDYLARTVDTFNHASLGALIALGGVVLAGKLRKLRRSGCDGSVDHTPPLDRD